MGTIREYQRKITSLKNTRKITGSMKMISSIKLQRMTQLRNDAQPFINAIRHLQPVIETAGSLHHHSFIRGWNTVVHLHVLLVTGDRGLCGRYNKNTISAMLQHSDKAGERPVTFSSIGHKGHHFLRRRSLEVIRFYEDAAAHPSWEAARDIGADLVEYFASGSAHEVWIVHSRRSSTFTEEPVVRRLLPLSLETPSETFTGSTDYLLEDSPEHLMRQTVLLYIQGTVYEALLDSAVAEHSARMSAMDNASSNCDRLLGQYTQLRNRARQAVITTELNEIVTGKEALEA